MNSIRNTFPLLSLLWSPVWLLSLSLAGGAAHAEPATVRYTVVGIGGPGTDGLAINSLGDIAGVVRDLDMPQAFLHADDALKRLGTLGGGESYGAGAGATDNGHVVGMATTADNHRRAFFYADGAMSDIGTLGGTESTATGINNAGQVVGTSSILGDAASHGFFYSDGAMRDLNSLIDPALGWTIHFAYDINDHGQIAAAGCRAGDCVALRLDPAVAPVPEPPACAALGCGLALLAMSLCMHRAPPVFRIAG